MLAYDKGVVDGKVTSGEDDIIGWQAVIPGAAVALTSLNPFFRPTLPFPFLLTYHQEESTSTKVQPISIVYFTSRGARLALGKSNELGISGANGVW